MAKLLSAFSDIQFLILFFSLFITLICALVAFPALERGRLRRARTWLIVCLAAIAPTILVYLAMALFGLVSFFLPDVSLSWSAFTVLVGTAGVLVFGRIIVVTSWRHLRDCNRRLAARGSD